MKKSFDSYSFLKKYQELQYGIMYDELTDIGFAIIGYSEIDDSTFWNVALVNSVLNDQQIAEVEKKFSNYNRRPTFYFENSSHLDGLMEKLNTSGYKKDYEDSFQFWGDGDIDEKHFSFVKKVETPKQLEAFLQTFDACYQKNDPQNPYDELGSYLKVAEKDWHKHHNSDRMEYFIVYKGEVPVAVSTLTNHSQLGYISNVGSLKEVRGEGYGKAATLYCIKRSLENKNTEHCLATEEGSYPDTFYRQIGFATRCRALAYAKQKAPDRPKA